MTRKSPFLILIALPLCVLTAGCGDFRSDRDGTSVGFVQNQTGDDDSQVSPELQQQVKLAFSQNENSDPVDF
jgi:hypothetical protein